jgi:glycosyltransferase involved in cell wall biosynthesis
LRDDPESFAEACIRLLKNKDLAVRIGQNGRSSVVGQYDKNYVVERIKMYLNNFGQDIHKYTM